MRKFFLFAAVGLVIFTSALIFALRWAIVTGRAKHQAADAEYHTEQNIRVIYHAQREYYVRHQYLGFPCTFSTLTSGPDPLLDGTFASGHVDGYTFSFSNCKHEENVGFNGNLTYRLTATPDPGSTILLPTYCVDDDVENIPPGEYVMDRPVILSGAPGSSACTQPIP